MEEIIIKGYNDKLFTIECDITFTEHGIFEGLMEFLQREEIKFELIEWNGPAGGWPIIKFTGTYESLAILLGDYLEEQHRLEEIKEIQ